MTALTRQEASIVLSLAPIKNTRERDGLTVESTIVGFYQAEGIESPGITPADFARVIAGD